MATLSARLRDAPHPPIWLTVLVATGTVLVCYLTLPFGLDQFPDVFIEGTYLLLAVLIAIPVRRLRIGILDLGWQCFVLGRLVDFMDELFVEPEPIVEPYLSGLLMVVSFSILVAGTYVLLEDRNDRIGKLDEFTSNLSLKNRVMEEAPIGITVADMTREDEPLIDINEAFTEITGHGVAETIGRNCRFLQGEATDPDAVARMREAIDDGESVQVTIRNYRKDGTRFWNEITLAPIQDEDGEIRHYAGFQQDATERKEYERRLQEQRDDLDLLNQMLQHDIRNDLHSMIANARLLEEHVTEEGRGRLEEIEQSVKEAVSLADTARDLSATMLAENPERRPISLSESLGSEIDDVESTFDDVVTEIDGSIPDVTIEADDLVNSVFRNLLRNAVQHNDTDVPKLTVSATRTDDHVQVRIADNGPGIPDERKDEIFGRGHTGLDSDGTGIGTYLVDTLVRRYGGEVWIEDNDPSGAIFVVQLPVAE